MFKSQLFNCCITNFLWSSSAFWSCLIHASFFAQLNTEMYFATSSYSCNFRSNIPRTDFLTDKWSKATHSKFWWMVKSDMCHLSHLKLITSFNSENNDSFKVNVMLPEPHIFMSKSGIKCFIRSNRLEPEETISYLPFLMFNFYSINNN